ncbi:hypothetical protein ABK040_008138 [Willaertia magna]
MIGNNLSRKQLKNNKRFESQSLEFYKQYKSHLLFRKNKREIKLEDLKLIYKNITLELFIEHIFQFIPYYELITKFSLVCKEWYFSIWQKHFLNSSISKLLKNFSKSLKYLKHFNISYNNSIFYIPLLNSSNYVYDDDYDNCILQFKIEPIVLFGKKLNDLNNLQLNTKKLLDKNNTILNDPFKKKRIKYLPFELDHEFERKGEELKDLIAFKKEINFITIFRKIKQYIMSENTNSRIVVEFTKNSNSLQYLFIVNLFLYHYHTLINLFFPRDLKREIKKGGILDKYIHKSVWTTIAYILRELMTMYYILFNYRHYSSKYENAVGVGGIKLRVVEKRIALRKKESDDCFIDDMEVFSQLIDSLYGIEIVSDVDDKIIGFIGLRMVHNCYLH